MASSVPTDTATVLASFFVLSDRLRRKFLRLLVEEEFILHNDGEDEEDFVDPREIEHVRLRSGFSLNDILASDVGVTWESFFEYFEKKVVWLTGDSFLYPEAHPFEVANPDRQCFWTWTVRIDETAHLHQTLFCTPEDEHEASDFLLDLVTRSDPRSVALECGNVVTEDVPHRALPLQGRSLVQLWAGKHLEDFEFNTVLLSVAHWQALETVSRSDLELKLSYCKLLSNDESHREAMVQCLQESKGPTSMIDVSDTRTFSRAVLGNTRITTISYLDDGVYLDEEALAAFGRALFQMQGLNKLRMLSNDMEKCITLFPMLQGHSTLNMIYAALPYRTEQSAALKTEFAYVLANLARTTPGLHEIKLDRKRRDEQVFKNKVVPHLEANLHRPRVKAVAKITCDNLRRQVLGRALAGISENVNLLWLYLSENIDAVFFAGQMQEQLGGKRKRK